MSEAVRISRTGSERILNSKGMYNRCELPRIVAKDTREILSLGDSEGREDIEEYEDEGFEEETRMMTKETKRKLKKQRMRDNLQWGVEEVREGRWYDDVLSEGDESLVGILEDLCQLEASEKEREEQEQDVSEEHERCLKKNMKQEDLSKWVVKRSLEKKVKVSESRSASQEATPPTIYSGLEIQVS